MTAKISTFYNTVGSGHFFVTVFAEKNPAIKSNLIAASVNRDTVPVPSNTFQHPDS
jgi:hypothetical protein